MCRKTISIASAGPGAGREGAAVSLVSGEEQGLLRDIERLIGRAVPREVLAGYETGSAPGRSLPRGRRRAAKLRTAGVASALATTASRTVVSRTASRTVRRTVSGTASGTVSRTASGTASRTASGTVSRTASGTVSRMASGTASRTASRAAQQYGQQYGQQRRTASSLGQNASRAGYSSPRRTGCSRTGTSTERLFRAVRRGPSLPALKSWCYGSCPWERGRTARPGAPGRLKIQTFKDGNGRDEPRNPSHRTGRRHRRRRHRLFRRLPPGGHGLQRGRAARARYVPCHRGPRRPSSARRWPGGRRGAHRGRTARCDANHVQHAVEVELAFVGDDLGAIAVPLVVEPVGGEVAPDQVRRPPPSPWRGAIAAGWCRGPQGGKAPCWAMERREIRSAATNETRSGSCPACSAASTISERIA